MITIPFFTKKSITVKVDEFATVWTNAIEAGINMRKLNVCAVDSTTDELHLSIVIFSTKLTMNAFLEKCKNDGLSVLIS